MEKFEIIRIPNILGQSSAEVEHFYELVLSAPQANHYQFDMREVQWIKPYGVVALILAARYLAKKSDDIVQIRNIKQEIHLYLNRMDVLGNSQWLVSTETLSDEWLRNPQTPNLLELTQITGPKDVETIITRAQQVFKRWLMQNDLDNLINVLAEVCANIYQHSGDVHGCALIQTNKMPSKGKRIVCLAVGDLGCGIQGSMVRRYGEEIGKEPLDYLHEALQGRTSRASGRGGLGLRTVRQIAYASGGYLWLRSNTASICSQANNILETRQNLAAIPGTQLAVELQAPLNI